MRCHEKKLEMKLDEHTHDENTEMVFFYNDNATIKMLHVTCVCKLCHYLQKMRTFTPRLSFALNFTV
ncbi:hypothetical protein PUN28_019996 [Cardiocondyla obscurior]|uniref:Uncharacterized protein n=1 Tax=Cardiocondyla obscurior TaxID=286306 RepID=A0AAW2E980_9HYME